MRWPPVMRPSVGIEDSHRTLEFAAATYASAFRGVPVRAGQISPGDPFFSSMSGGAVPWAPVKEVARVSLAVHDDGDGAITVRAGDVELFRYVYIPDDCPQLESPKPYLHPIRTRAGHLVSLFRPHDHVWHKGIAWSLPWSVSENFWGGPTYVHGQFYVQLPNDGSPGASANRAERRRKGSVARYRSLTSTGSRRSGDQYVQRAADDHGANRSTRTRGC